jgi:hypothetical protein
MPVIKIEYATSRDIVEKLIRNIKTIGYLELLSLIRFLEDNGTGSRKKM